MAFSSLRALLSVHWDSGGGGGSSEGDTGVFAGGNDSGTLYDVIDYVTISSTSNATDFGDISSVKMQTMALSNGGLDRGLIAGGGNIYTQSPFSTNDIDYITVSTPSNSTDFGDLYLARTHGAGTSNLQNDRGIFAGGKTVSNVNGFNETIDYVTVSTTGNAQDFGDLIYDVYETAALSNGKNNRGLIAGGERFAGSIMSSSTPIDVISYVDISSAGNSSDFGDLTNLRMSTAAASNGTNERGCFIGGSSYTGSSFPRQNSIEYVTINTPGNAIDFGDLSATREAAAGTSNQTNNRAINGGGTYPVQNTIDYFDISTLSNSSDFGDLTTARTWPSALSNAGTSANTTPNNTAAPNEGTSGFIVAGYLMADVEKVNISSAGNAIYYGELTYARYGATALSNHGLDRAVVAGGEKTGLVNIIDYFNMNTVADSADFGDLNNAVIGPAGISNGQNDKGLVAGGGTSSTVWVNNIDQMTISSAANATDFGDLTETAKRRAGLSNGTNDRGIFGGGIDSASYSNVIEYVTISSASNATDFGDISVARHGLAAASNGTNERGLFAGGYTGSLSDVIDYITINSASNATDFGDLFESRYTLAGTSSQTNERGIFGGGQASSGTNVIDYVTISSGGNAADFGDLKTARNNVSSTSNAGLPAPGGSEGDTGIIWAIYLSSSPYTTDTIEYITISSPSNATDFGDMTTATLMPAGATSNDGLDKGIQFCGMNASGQYRQNIDQVTLSTPGNATNWGSLGRTLVRAASLSNGQNDRGLIAGGIATNVSGSGETEYMEYVTISSSSGGYTAFGDLTAARKDAAAASNGRNERGLFAGGMVGNYNESNIIDYITINSASNATDFGDLVRGREPSGVGMSNGTNDRAVFGTGSNDAAYPTPLSTTGKELDYVTISSLSNASDFGDLSADAIYKGCATDNRTNDRGVIWGGYEVPAGSNARPHKQSIDYITISSLGNSLDFGDLTNGTTTSRSCSNAGT